MVSNTWQGRNALQQTCLTGIWFCIAAPCVSCRGHGIQTCMQSTSSWAFMHQSGIWLVCASSSKHLLLDNFLLGHPNSFTPPFLLFGERACMVLTRMGSGLAFQSPKHFCMQPTSSRSIAYKWHLVLPCPAPLSMKFNVLALPGHVWRDNNSRLARY